MRCIRIEGLNYFAVERGKSIYVEAESLFERKTKQMRKTRESCSSFSIEFRLSKMGVQSLSSATEALEDVLNPPVAVYKTNGSMINTKGMKIISRALIGDFSFAGCFDMGDLLQALKLVEESGDFPMIGWFDDDDDDDEEPSTSSGFSLIMPPSKRRCGGLVRYSHNKVESDLASLAVDSSSDIRHVPTTSSFYPLSSLSKIFTISSSNPLSSLSRLSPSRPPLSLRTRPISPTTLSLSKSLSKSSFLIPKHMAFSLEPSRIRSPGARVA